MILLVKKVLNQQRLSQKVMKAEADDSSFCKVGLGCVRKWSIVFRGFDNFLSCPGSTSAFSWSRSFRAQSRRIEKVSSFFHHLPTVELASSTLYNLPNNAQQHLRITFQRTHVVLFSRSLEGGSGSNRTHCGIGIGLDGARNYHPRAHIFIAVTHLLSLALPRLVLHCAFQRERERERGELVFA